jgi:hypothetical protein
MAEGVVTRLREGAYPEPDPDLRLSLLVRPKDPCPEDLEDAEFRAAWEAYGDEIMEMASPDCIERGWRPYAWWLYEVGELPPEDERARLAELGEPTGARKR